MVYHLYDMKRIMLLCAAIIIIVFVSGCSQPYPPAADVNVLEYSVESSESGYTADISYRDGQNEIIQLEDEPLPWSMPITLDDDFTGTAYLTAEVSEAQVFQYYLNGTADGVLAFRLVDSTADFTAEGIIVGDKVFNTDDPTVQSAALITEIEDSHNILLNIELFPGGNEPYYIYHKKTLTSKIILNGETIDTDFEENVRMLSTLVKETIDL